DVTVHVKRGEGEASTATTTASGGKWSPTVSTALPAGNNKFTAYATEMSGIGNLDGKSEPPVSFEVDTEPPEVEITKGPEPRSNDINPTFAGTASENTEVTVHVFEGLTKVAEAKTTASGGKWETVTSLPKGERHLRAYATEKSGINNGDGTSNEVEFEVDTLAPAVTIVGPPTPSKNTTPKFSGEADR